MEAVIRRTEWADPGEELEARAAEAAFLPPYEWAADELERRGAELLISWQQREAHWASVRRRLRDSPLTVARLAATVFAVLCYVACAAGYLFYAWNLMRHGQCGESLPGFIYGGVCLVAAAARASKQ